MTFPEGHKGHLSPCCHPVTDRTPEAIVALKVPIFPLPFPVLPRYHSISMENLRTIIARTVLLGLVLAGGFAPTGLGAAATAVMPVREKPVNLLFIITDQQRWDAMSCAGNPELRTPNMDRLARDGARFTSCYSACPVCVPARTAILTGRSLESNRVLSNGDVNREDAVPFPSFDQVLLRSGYHGEYHGKYHSPYKLALDYSKPVRWLNGKNPPAGCVASMSEAEAYRAYIKASVPGRELRPGELMQRGGIYQPIPLDAYFGKPIPKRASQAQSYGKFVMSNEHSISAFTARAGIAALDRLKDGPFTLTISLDPPHPPMIVSEPYYSMYPADQIAVPVSINASRTNSPYLEKPGPLSRAYRLPSNIRQMRSIYYGMVAEVDDWVGRILKRLDDLGLRENTLVVFTSDHGEMLGDHGMHGKFVFHDGSARVPLLLRLPGKIPAKTVIEAPVSHLDLFPTILDYLGKTGHESEGRNLRPLIEGRERGTQRVAVSEWPTTRTPGFMICDGRWKLMYGRAAGARSLDALYDLQSDPHEMNNLIGRNPNREKVRPEVIRLKGLLVDWLTGVKSPHLEAVRARPLFATSSAKN
jgi:arylsulfatase A-like enzyme